MNNEVFRIADTVNHRTTRRDLIMAFDGKTGVMYELNDTASDVFRLIDGTRTFEKICAEISSDYDVSADEIREDVTELISRLKETGIIAETETTESA